MDRNDSKKLKVTAGLVAAGVIGLTVQAQGGRNCMTASTAERTLVYGHVDSEWAKRTAKLVQAEPELATRLANIAISNAVDDVGRGLVLDALAQAGSDAAQEAMRETLAALHDDAVYPALLTSLGQLTAPSSETLTYVSDARARAFDEVDCDAAFAAQQTLDEVYGHRLAVTHTKRHARASSQRQRGE
jgi:hypothetical protein